MKTKYQRMNKEEKKNLIEEYKKTTKGKEMLSRLNRILAIGLIGLIYGVGLALYLYSKDGIKINDYLTIIPLLIASFIFIIMSLNLRKKELNKFAIKRK
ncbi:MAG: hypothetical protein HFJ02_02705 [Bacilli bacterium]|nr:hypothetical protein [Bacilli bacterium]